MIKPRKLQPIKVTCGEEEIAFYPRMVFKSERDDVERQMADVNTESLDRGKKTFEIQRDAVAAWSSAPPKRIVKEKGETQLTDLIEGVENAPDAMTQLFSDFTVESEEIISSAYYGYLTSMKATVSFL